MNLVILVGRVGKDPVLNEKKTVASFSLATSTKYKGEKQTQWHSIKCFSKLVDTVSQYVSKGRELSIEGKIEYRTYEKKDGTKGYGTDIIANRVEFIGSKGEVKSDRDVIPKQEEFKSPFTEDDIPF